MNILLIGPQGSGKGTQADKLSQHYHLHHIEAGALIRDQAHQHSQKAEIIDHLANKKGILLPDGIVIDMIIDQLDHIGYDNLLFDGFPRTLSQYQSLKDILDHHPLDAAIYLDIPDDVAINRLSARLVCTTCHTSFNSQTEPDRSTCDQGHQLTKRPDDQPQAIKSRLDSFHQSTQPILHQLEQDGILIKIDGQPNVDQIFDQIKQRLQSIESSN